MDLFESRIEPGGLHLLDEPEAPLSPKRQIELVDRLVDASRRGAQVIIATHSPIVLSGHGARVFDFDRTPITETEYENLDHVRVTREFLNRSR